MLITLRAQRVKRAKIWLHKAAKIYRLLYDWGGGGGASLCSLHTSL